MAEYANVIVDISHEKLDKIFQYRIPIELQARLKVGMQVHVPFGKVNKDRTAYVIGLGSEAEYDAEKLKDVSAIEEKAISVETRLIALADWIRTHYGGTMNQALKTVLPVKRQIRQAKSGPRNPIDSMGFSSESRNETHGSVDAKPEAPIVLNFYQQSAVDGIWADYRAGLRETYLLHGVTGSGKTAVYMELVSKVAEAGRQAIVLIPEIALTYQTVLRFYRRFGERVSVLHSRMSAGERYDQFMRAKNGELDVMIGPRSALFTPFSQLGLIIIDEEHESSYNSEGLPRYHARETAIQRARMEDASVLLGSATPSIESYFQAKSGHYRLYELSKRVGAKPLPKARITDLREELRQGNRSILSEALQERIEDRLEKKQQVMLFLNRRGMAGFVSCRSCGHVFSCPHCDISLNRHNDGKLHCHYCGYQEPAPKRCPVCGSRYVSGFKAGTQKIEEVVRERFPQARVLRMDLDTTKNKRGHEKILTAFAEGQADILIGTQMIVKGHDFPYVTLVGVLAADLSLNSGDYGGAERTFQLLVQAAGRAGRGGEKGEVLIQTYNPEHYVIRLAAEQDYRAFYEQEMAYRSLMHYPPVWNMMLMSVTSKEQAEAGRLSEILAQKMRQAIDAGKVGKLQLIGPGDAPISKIHDVYRKFIYFKHPEYGMLVKVKDVLEDFVSRHREFDKGTVQFDFTGNPLI